MVLSSSRTEAFIKWATNSCLLKIGVQKTPVCNKEKGDDVMQIATSPFFKDSYLVDPASSHMLVSKIKPCMSKYKQICTVKLRMAH